MKHLLFFLLCASTGCGSPWLHNLDEPGGFPLLRKGLAAEIMVSADDFKVVALAANNLQRDIEAVGGVAPKINTSGIGTATPTVIIGTLGKSPLIDGLVLAGKLNVSSLRGQWESFIITTVDDAMPGVPQALVIAGSDRRGTAYGVYELAQAIGVSPWHWWADVAPTHQNILSVAAGTRRFGPPSVQYRGIFINDEDWGLQPWAAKTFEPETGDIGPKTYAKVCELLLRLKANTLWPAMHACTKAFNLYPQNKVVADDHAIVMGSSHAEPMLRNNVTEWTAPPATYNYVSNREGVRAYWEQRIKENGRFENIYTLGMRGIHDSHMQGPTSDAERISTLEKIFADQRALLTKHVSPVIESVPQIFCAYKEVLDLYRQGLKVPEDVTIVWPDDNFGYVRNFANATEQKRSGGFGVYYHISYLGAPLSYLWLETTPPALIREEMSKAYDHGARKIWIVNVGDLKPAEIGTEFFLQMAWDIKRWDRSNLPSFLPEWAGREFGADHAAEIAGIMEGYYHLNFERRPEHLQWWMPGKPPHASPLGETEIDRRLEDFSRLHSDSERIAASLPAPKRDAFEELVGYPVRGAALANIRYFQGERGNLAAAEAADLELKESTHRFNEQLADGKWNHVMTLEPADNQWKSMRLAAWKPPEFQRPRKETGPKRFTVPATRFVRKTSGRHGSWEIVPGIGVAIFPTTAPSVGQANLMKDAPRLDYEVEFPAAGASVISIQLLPTHPLNPSHGLRFGISLNGQPPQLIVCEVKDGSPDWAQGVLNNYLIANAVVDVPAKGLHTVQIYGVDAGVVLKRLTIGDGESSPSTAKRASMHVPNLGDKKNPRSDLP